MRLEGLDIARGLAFFGMVLVNFRIAAGVMPLPDLPSTLTSLLEGRAAALFVVLAGIGMILSRATPALLFRRALFLFVLGMINVTIFDADILHFYALYFLCALPLLGLSARALLLGALVITLIAYGALFAFNFDAGWDWETYIYADFWTLTGFARHSFYNGWHPVFPWLAFLLIGMALAKLDLRRSCTQHRMVLWGLAAGCAGLIPGWLVHDPELTVLFGTAPIPPTPFYILSASGSACAVIGALLWFGQGFAATRLGRAIAAVGRQSLSFYIIHIFIGMGILEGLGRLDGSLSPWEIFAYICGFCALCLPAALIWQNRFGRGPLELLMRRLAG